MTIKADQASLEEGDGPATFTVTRAGYLEEELVVSAAIEQTGDYLQSTDTHIQQTILAGDSTATFSIPLVDDDTHEADGEVKLTLADLRTYDVGAPGVASTTLTSSDARQHVYLQAREMEGSNPLLSEIMEGQNATFLVTRREWEGPGPQRRPDHQPGRSDRHPLGHPGRGLPGR